MKINGNPDGGGGSGVITSISISANGTYTAGGGVDGYSPVEVSVPMPVLGSATGKYNGMYYPSEFGVEAFDQFEVYVPEGDGTWSNPFNVEWAVDNEIIGTTETSSMYVRGYVTSVLSGFSQTGNYGNATFLVGSTSDGEALLSTYRILYFDNKKYNSYPGEASKPDVQVGDEVIMYGAFNRYQGQPQTVANKNYIYAINGVYGVGVGPGTEYYIDQNGYYSSLNYYENIVVEVSAPAPVTESLSVSVNGTYTPGQGVDGFSQVVVDVPQSVTGFTQKEITEQTLNIVNLNNSASFVSANVFWNSSYLETVDLPNCTVVNMSAFTGCRNLLTVNLPVCTTINNSAFLYCSSLAEVSLPLVESIYYDGFSGCSMLSMVNLPSCVGIQRGAFQSCSNLQSISLPVCTFIGESAFRNCKSLQAIDLPSCGIIGSDAFKGCNSLSIISLSVCSIISTEAFRGASLIEMYIYTSQVCSLSNAALNNTPIVSGTGSIYVPTSLVDTYKSATNWSVFSSQIFPIE